MPSQRRLELAAALLATVAFLAWNRWSGPKIATVSPQRADIVQTLVTIGRVAAPAEITFAARESTKITRCAGSTAARRWRFCSSPIRPSLPPAATASSR